MVEGNGVTAYRIEKLQEGGFVVSEAPGTDASRLSDGGGFGRFHATVFASASIGDALMFVCSKLDHDDHKRAVERAARANVLLAREDAASAEKAQGEVQAERAIAGGLSKPARVDCTCWRSAF